VKAFSIHQEGSDVSSAFRPFSGKSTWLDES
jgi:hypothetical protein